MKSNETNPPPAPEKCGYESRIAKGRFCTLPRLHTGCHVRERPPAPIPAAEVCDRCASIPTLCFCYGGPKRLVARPSPAPTVQRESKPCDCDFARQTPGFKAHRVWCNAMVFIPAPAPQRCDEQRPQRGTEEMRQFSLNRIEDETGISGIGVVAQGVIFADGRVAMRWLTAHTSFCFYDSIDEVEAIHGHNGRTRIEYLAENERLKDENIHHEFEIENLTARLRASQEVRERLCEKLATATSRLRQCEEANHRAFKLMERGTPFFVVKASEPYARQVVNLIKEHEGWKWTDEDELWALRALAAPAPDVLDKISKKGEAE